MQLEKKIERFVYIGKVFGENVSNRDRLIETTVKLCTCLGHLGQCNTDNGSFTLATFVSGTVSDSDTCLYLPWPPRVTQWPR